MDINVDLTKWYVFMRICDSVFMRIRVKLFMLIVFLTPYLPICDSM